MERTQFDDAGLPGSRQAVRLIQTFVADMSCYATALELRLDGDARKSRRRAERRAARSARARRGAG